MDEQGVCPFCYTREGPLLAHGLQYFFCLRHGVRWIRPSSRRQDSPEAVARARDICRRTAQIPYARSWRPAAGPVRG